MREPVLLGNDGRVRDGHHRIAASVYLGLEEILVEEFDDKWQPAKS